VGKNKQISKKVEKGQVVSNKEIAPEHYLLKAHLPHISNNSIPGQFVNIKINSSSTDPLLRIPLGIHAVEGETVQFLYKVVGSGTRWLSQKTKGSEIDILGPLGKGFRIKDTKALLVSGGHGIAPLYGLAEELSKKGIEIEFIAGVKNAEHLTCVEKLENLGIKVHIATEDGSAGTKGYVTDLLKSRIFKEVTIYSCGPKPMLKAVALLAAKANVEAQVSVDEYMACGIGACKGCAILTTEGYKLVCKDGPVFDSQIVEWGN
jgi:dihydroorotate dehydrogenase electron transfer subunit